MPQKNFLNVALAEEMRREAAQEVHANKNAWSYFMRFGIFLSMVGFALMIVSVDDPAWVETKIRETAPHCEDGEACPTAAADVDLMNPVGTRMSAVGVFGNIRKAEFGILNFCMQYNVIDYANQSVSVCWAYSDSVTIQGTKKQACDFMDGVGLCNTVDNSRIALFLALALIGIADVFSEKSAVCSALFGLAVSAAIANMVIWISFMAEFKDQDETLGMVWASGLTNFCYGTLCLLFATVMMVVAFYCWDFDDHDKCLCGCIGYLYAKDEEGKVNHSSLSKRQQFFKDGVGPWGRLGAFFGLVTWVLLLLSASTVEWLVIDREDISASLSGFDQLDGGGRIGLGDTYAVLKRDITTAGGDLVDIVAYNKFGLDQPVNLRGPNGTVLTTMKPLKEAFEENEVNFDKHHSMAGQLLVLGAVAAFIGDIYSEYTAINGVLCFFAFGCGVACCFYSLELVGEINDLAPGFVAIGPGLNVIMAATVLALFSFLLNMVDSRMYGSFKDEKSANEKAKFRAADKTSVA